MPVDREQEFIVSVFLMEAWDAIAELEGGLAAGALPPAPLVSAWQHLHTTASQHGFPAIARLAASVHAGLARLTDRDDVLDATRADLAARLDALKALLDGLALNADDEVSTPVAFPVSEPAAVSEASPLLGLSADVLEYFGPEVAEHLDAMTASLRVLERDAANADEFGRLFRAVHTLKGAAYTVGAPLVGDLVHAMEDHLVALSEAHAPLGPALAAAMVAGIDAVKALVGLPGAPDDDAEMLLQVARGRLAALTAAAPVVTVPDVAPERPPDPVPAPVRTIADETPAPPAPRDRQRIRVSVERLDRLMHLVGELATSRRRLERRLDELQRVGERMLTSRSRMTHAVERFEAKQSFGVLPGEAAREAIVPAFPELELDRHHAVQSLARSVAEIARDLGKVQGQLATIVRTVGEETAQVQRLTDALRGEVAQARMVPIGGLFARFARHVRDLARGDGKAVTVELSGEDIAVDDRVVEAIADALLHMVRNAVAHGIESEAERVAAGKPAAGTVRLAAVQRGAFVQVEVADDGRGIDVPALAPRAVARGLIGADEAARLSEREALDLIFLPGFSTAASATSVAGRGVGMDVVRTNVSRLNGEVSIDTTPGLGTRFTLRVPLTVTMADTLMVRAADETFAIPMSAVKVVLEVPALDSDTLVVDGEPLPVISLGATLGLPPGDRGSRVPVVVMRTGRATFALVVDAVAGQDEVVVQTVAAFLDGDGPFSGATISADGAVIMIVDPARLLEESRGVTRGAFTASPAPVVPAAHRVLLVDDSVTAREFVAEMLERAGFQVTLAHDGAEALETLAEDSFDVVVTDLDMPRLDGYQLIRDLRAGVRTREVPIVVVTTRTAANDAELAHELGVHHYVTKPVDPERFVHLIESLVDGQAAAR